MNRTLLFGEGLFETIRWTGESRKVRLHYRRLSRSAAFFEIPCPSYEEFLKALRTASGGKINVCLRFSLLSSGSDRFADAPSGYEIRVDLRDVPPLPRRVELTVSSLRRHSGNPLFRHKTVNYMFNVLVRREAHRGGFYDAIVLNEREELTECSASNLLLLIGGKLYTPSPESGLLWGTTLDVLSKEMNVRVERLDRSHLERAESLFITNSLIGVVPVHRINNRRLKVDSDLLGEMRTILSRWEAPLGGEEDKI